MELRGRLGMLVAFGLIGISLLTSGCGASLLGNTATATSTATYTTSLQILGISPAAGAYASQPTTFTITFNESNLDPTSANALTSYSISCGNSTAYATNVSYIGGQTQVNITVPSLTVTTGESCQLVVGQVLDVVGNVVSGPRQASYTIGSASSVFTWTEQSTAVLVAPGGSQALATFDQAGSAGYALAGFNVLVVSTSVNGATYNLIGGVQGVWESSAGASSAGTVDGSTSTTNATIACPNGERVNGIYGYYGTYVNGLGVLCNNAYLTSPYQSTLQGSATGSYFSAVCPQGEFATVMYGAVSGELVNMGLGCQ